MTKSFQSNPSIYLLPDEKIIFKTNPHWLFIVIPIATIFIFWIIYLLFICSFIGTVLLDEFVNFCILISSFASVFLIVILYLDWRFNRLYLTNLRLIKEKGIIGKRFMSIRLDNVEDITCTFGILGRIFGFGDLIIESAGTSGKMVFKGMPKPRKIKLKIEKEMGQIISSVS